MFFMKGKKRKIPDKFSPLDFRSTIAIIDISH
nr:MAG TPA: hypothetical protein [Caudoviricetes sp.]